MTAQRTPLKVAGPSSVRPLKGSCIDRKMRKNAQWLFTLKPDRLLAPLRANCGLDVCGARAYNGWKDYYYYYLRAMCNLYASFQGVDDAIAGEARERALYMTRALLECQQKTAETCPPGFITPEMDRLFVDRTRLVRDSIYSHTHIEAVMYSVHKVLLDFVLVYRTFGMSEALDGAKRMAERVHGLMAPFSQEEREKMTNSRRTEDFFSEAGGIMDGFLQLYAETGDPIHLETAGFFRRRWFDRMFLEDDDRLAWGMEHANSEIPYVEALVDQYVQTGEESALRAAREFMRVSHADHELPQGSVSGRSAFPDYQSELYNYPKRVFFHIMDTPARKNISSGESCCAHNLNRVSAKLLEIEPDVALMDAWERRFVNAVLAQQNPDNGMFIYNLNLKNNAYKMWGYPTKSFWCCYGTGAEVFAALTEGAFYESETAAYACLYMPCEYTHSATGLRIVERTAYPDDGHIRFEVYGSGELSLFLRLPGWLNGAARIVLPDGGTADVDRRGEFYEIRRNWRDGDVVEMELPFALHYECMPDRHEYVSLTYGPNLEVLCAPGEQLFPGDAAEFLAALEPSGAPCTFVAEFQSESAGGAHVIKPIRAIKDETYSGYFRMAKAPEERIQDELLLGSGESRAAHGFRGTAVHLGSERGHAYALTSLTFCSDQGEMLFEMTSDPEQEELLRLYLDGSARAYIHQFSGHVVNPLFDLQVMCDGEWRTFATKSMEADYPGEIYYENFVIPKAWTLGQSRLQFRLAARNFHDIPGVIETLVDRIVLFSVPKDSGTLTETGSSDETEKAFVPNAQGL